MENDGSGPPANGVPVGLVVGVGSRGGSDKEIEGSGSEMEGTVLVGLESSDGSDKEIVGSGSEMVRTVLVGVGSRGGSDRVNEGSGSTTGVGDTVGSEITGTVLESCPSSRLKTSPLARAAKSREETTTLANMISRRKESREV
jgi:hypothetical protein